MSKSRFQKVTIRRLSSAFSRRIADIPHALSWMWGGEQTTLNLNKLVQFKDIHLNQRCFIIGNGPSLKALDLSLLQNEFTFGLNRIYLLFDKLPSLPTYYVSINELVLGQYAAEIQKLPMVKFLNWNCRDLFNPNDPSVCFLRLSQRVKDVFVPDPTQPICSGGTVTYVALQLAFYMGFSEVILIGVDHSFVDIGTPNEVVLQDSDIDLNHFDPHYFPKGSKWQLPDLARSEIAYMQAREFFEKSGRRITDATLGGKCNVFDKQDFESFFRR